MTSPSITLLMLRRTGYARCAMDLILKEELIRARLSELGFDLEREPGELDWIVRDRREWKEFMKAVPATRCQELDTIIEFFGLEL